MKPWFVLGLDLGMMQNFSALCVVEITGSSSGPRHAVRHLHRWHLGTKYTQVRDDVKALVATAPLSHPPLVVDGTGVGVAVVDIFLEAAMQANLVPAVITSGSLASIGSNGWVHVPKKELVSVLQVLLQNRRLEIAPGLKDAAVLAKEMGNFKVKITTAANETFGAWREGDQDDLVLSVALACWFAESASRAEANDAAGDGGDAVAYT